MYIIVRNVNEKKNEMDEENFIVYQTLIPY